MPPVGFRSTSKLFGCNRAHQLRRGPVQPAGVTCARCPACCAADSFRNFPSHSPLSQRHRILESPLCSLDFPYLAPGDWAQRFCSSCVLLPVQTGQTRCQLTLPCRAMRPAVVIPTKPLPPSIYPACDRGGPTSTAASKQAPVRGAHGGSSSAAPSGRPPTVGQSASKKPMFHSSTHQPCAMQFGRPM